MKTAVERYYTGARLGIRELADLPKGDLPTLCERISDLITYTDRAEPTPEEHGELYVYRFALSRAQAALATETSTRTQIEQCEAKLSALSAHLEALRASLPRAAANLSLLDKRGVMLSAEFKSRVR